MSVECKEGRVAMLVLASYGHVFYIGAQQTDTSKGTQMYGELERKERVVKGGNEGVVGSLHFVRKRCAGSQCLASSPLAMASSHRAM